MLNQRHWVFRAFLSVIGILWPITAFGGPKPRVDFTNFFAPAEMSVESLHVATDPKGHVYVAGITRKAGLPTVNAIQAAIDTHESVECNPRGPLRESSCHDLFMGKLLPDGSGFVYLTYLGGSGDESVSDITVDAKGDLYVSGVTSSPEFPFTVDLDPDGSSGEAYALKLSPDGSELIYSARLPRKWTRSLSEPAVSALAVDGSGALYIVGSTVSPDFPEVNGLGLDPGRANVFRSDDAGETWITDNRGLGGNSIFSLGDAAKSLFGSFVVFASGRDFIYRKNGPRVPWSRLEGFKGGSIFGITDLAVHPNNSNRLYGLNSRRFFFTLDGGRSWYHDPDFDRLWTALAVAPSSPDRMYFGGADNIFRSDDGGLTFTPTRFDAFVEEPRARSLVVDPGTAETVYAVALITRPGGFGRRVFSRNDVLKSVDSGATWVLIHSDSESDLGLQITIDPNSPSTLYIGSRSRLLKSIDGGLTWIDQSEGIEFDADSLFPGIRSITIHSAESRTIYATTLVGIFKTTNGGDSWARIGELLPRGTRSIVLDPNGSDTLYALGADSPWNAFALKLSPDGSRAEYATLLGGGSDDFAFDLAVDGQGRAYILGTTSSLDFPATTGTFTPRREILGDGDGFVARLSADGSVLEASTLLGGRQGRGLAFDPDGNPLIAGTSGGDTVVSRLDKETLLSTGELGVRRESPRPATAVAAGPAGRICAAGDDPDPPLSSFSTDLPERAGFLACWTADGMLDFAANLDGIIDLAVDSSGRFVLAGRGDAGVSPLAGMEAISETTPYATRFDFANDPAGPRVAAALHGASLLARVPVPGQVVSIFGERLGPPDGAPAPVTEDRFPTMVEGTQVMIGGQPAPLLFVGEDQINAVVPFGVEPGRQVELTVARQGFRSPPFYLIALPHSPGVFSLDGSGGGRAAVLNEDGTLNSPGNRAKPGSVVQIFGTGGGAFSFRPEDGVIVPTLPPFPLLEGFVEVYIHFTPAEVLYAGAAPGLVPGVLQVNARVPEDPHAAESEVLLLMGDIRAGIFDKLPTISIDVP